MAPLVTATANRRINSTHNLPVFYTIIKDEDTGGLITDAKDFGNLRADALVPADYSSTLPIAHRGPDTAERRAASNDAG